MIQTGALIISTETVFCPSFQHTILLNLLRTEEKVKNDQTGVYNPVHSRFVKFGNVTVRMSEFVRQFHLNGKKFSSSVNLSNNLVF